MSTFPTLTSDVLHVVYNHLELHNDVQATLYKLVQVSRAFDEVFRRYLYRHLHIDIGDTRLARLVKTLQANPSLRNGIQSLKIRLSVSPDIPPLYRRIFPPTDHFLRFARLIIDTQPPSLNTLTLYSPRSGSNFKWMKLAQTTRNTLLDLRCKVPFRTLRLECIIGLRPVMIWGKEGSSPLDELHIFRIYTYSDPTDLDQIAAAPSPHSLRTLSVRPASAILLRGTLLTGLESIHIEQLPIPYNHIVEQLYAVVTASSATLRHLHLQVVHQPLETMACGFGTSIFQPCTTARLDLKKHSKLEILVISQDPPVKQPDLDPDDGVYEVTELNKEFLMCLRSIDLPPILPTLRVRMYVPEVVSCDSKPQFPAEQGFRSGWDWRSPTLDRDLVNLVQRSLSIQRVELCLISFPGVKVTRAALLGFETFFPLMKEAMDDAFVVCLDSQ